MRFLRYYASLPFVTPKGPSLDAIPGIELGNAHGGPTDLASICRFIFSSLRPAAVTAALITICLVAVPACASAAATTYTVNMLADVTDPTSMCAYGTNPTCSLRDAITLANANSGSIITFFPGLTGTSYLSSSNLPEISANMTIEGPGANLLTIDFQGANSISVNNASLSISGVTFADGARAVELTTNADAAIDRCVITGMNDNALYINSNSTLKVTNSLIYGNSTQGILNGAGIANYSGTLTVINSTITSNTSGLNGGGIYNNGTAIITNSTIAGNTANAVGSGDNGGAGIYNSGTVTIINSIVAGNTANNSAQFNDCSDCGTQSTNNIINGTPPALGPLAWNGGPIKTMLPLYGSTAIGAGNYVTGGPSADQRGFFRPLSGVIDLGAVQTHYLTVNTLTDSDDGICGATTCSLRDALEQAATNTAGDIRFSASGTIFLTSGKPLPAIAEDLNIAGPGASKLTIDGGQSSVVGSVLTIEEEQLVAISGVTITNGSAPETTNLAGGAITSYGQLTVSNSVISGNTSIDAGGGIVSNGEWLLVDNSTISGNTSYNAGGAIYNTDGSILIVNNSTLSGNTVNIGNGGGVWSNGGAVLVSNSTISGNTADEGGGIYFNCSSQSSCVGVTVNNSTISANTAASGYTAGGIFNHSGFGVVTAYNSIVAGNTTNGTANSGDCPNCGTQSKYNFIGGNPQLTPLQLTGVGAMQEVMVPMPGSPVMGAGSWIMSATGPTILTKAVFTDERGFPRPPVTSLIDLGAVQTNYTAIEFATEPSDVRVAQDIVPAPAVTVLETNPANQNEDGVAGIPITLTFSGGSSEIVNPSSLTAMTVGTEGLATFGALAVNTPGTNCTFTVASPVFGSVKVTSNTFNVLVLAATPTFSPAAGTYTSAQSVTISDATPGATIYYTTDGTVPTVNSTKYTGSIAVTATETISAIAVASGFANSAVASATYNLPINFAISVTPTALSVTGGQSGTATVSVTPQNLVPSAVSFTCSGLPTGATCSFSPATVTPSGTSTSNTTLTVFTATASAALQRNSNPLLPASTLAVAFCFFGWRKRRSVQLLLLLAVSVIGLSLFTGCGGGAGKTPVTSTITVTGTSGSGSSLVQNTTTFSLTVN